MVEPEALRHPGFGVRLCREDAANHDGSLAKDARCQDDLDWQVRQQVALQIDVTSRQPPSKNDAAWIAKSEQADDKFRNFPSSPGQNLVGYLVAIMRGLEQRVSVVDLALAAASPIIIHETACHQAGPKGRTRNAAPRDADGPTCDATEPPLRTDHCNPVHHHSGPDPTADLEHDDRLRAWKGPHAAGFGNCGEMIVLPDSHLAAQAPADELAQVQPLPVGVLRRIAENTGDRIYDSRDADADTCQLVLLNAEVSEKPIEFFGDSFDEVPTDMFGPLRPCCEDLPLERRQGPPGCLVSNVNACNNNGGIVKPIHGSWPTLLASILIDRNFGYETKRLKIENEAVDGRYAQGGQPRQIRSR